MGRCRLLRHTKEGIKLLVHPSLFYLLADLAVQSYALSYTEGREGMGGSWEGVGWGSGRGELRQRVVAIVAT